MKNSKLSVTAIAILGSLILSATGCVTLSENGKKPVESTVKQVSKKPTPGPLAKLTGNTQPKGKPESIVAIWKDATYTVTDQRPTRGFGGRLYFHDKDENAIVVDGELAVYGFVDDQNASTSPGKNQAPEKKFVFTKEDLPYHMSVSSAGPSYSFWLPWDHINGEQKNVTLIAVFKQAGENGRICKSEAIAALLPGKKSELLRGADQLVEEIHQRESEMAKKVGFAGNKPEGTRQIKTHEIKIPDGSKQRLFGSPPKTTYRLPEPKVMQASATEPIIAPLPADLQPSTGFSPDPRRAQSGRFERQGTLPPGSPPPRLGVKSSVEGLR